VPDPAAQARVALRAIYARVAEDLAARPELSCELSGRCCRFREAGHQLYLTRLEYEEMVARGGARPADPDACPWLEDGLCGNREGRALACRTYFCSDEKQAAEVTERWHAEIRNLHANSGLDYDYRSLASHMEGTAGSRE
jgi:hypothetical protein